MKQHPENRKRALWAHNALTTFHIETGSDLPEDALKDLICDLGHYADRHGLDFVEITRSAIAGWKLEQADPFSIETPPDVDIFIHDP